MFHTALASELARTAAPQYPMVPEGTYPYHWFFHALAAHLGRGFEPLVVVTHLLPLTFLLGVVAMAAVAARVVARHRWGAGVGAAAVGLVGMTQPGAWFVLTGITGRADTDGAGLDPIRLYWQHSASTTLGWLAALGVVAAAAPALRGGPLRRRDLALVLLMGVLAAGAKSAQTPVLLCGFATVVVVALLGRRWGAAARGGLLAAALALPWAVALVTMYAGGSQGLVVSPGERAVTLAARLTPALAPVGPDGDRVTTPLVLMTAVSLWLLPLLPRLLGLLWWARRPLDPAGLLCGATVVAGVAGTFLTGHPGGSDVFFLVCAYPVGLAGSAAGFVLATLRLGERWGWRPLAVAGTAAALAGATATAAARVVGGHQVPARDLEGEPARGGARRLAAAARAAARVVGTHDRPSARCSASRPRWPCCSEAGRTPRGCVGAPPASSSWRCLRWPVAGWCRRGGTCSAAAARRSPLASTASSGATPRRRASS